MIGPLFDPPSTVEELDALMQHINTGDGDLASLSDEQREQLKNELGFALSFIFIAWHVRQSRRLPVAA